MRVQERLYSIRIYIYIISPNTNHPYCCSLSGVWRTRKYTPRRQYTRRNRFFIYSIYTHIHRRAKHVSYIDVVRACGRDGPGKSQSYIFLFFILFSQFFFFLAAKETKTPMRWISSIIHRQILCSIVYYSTGDISSSKCMYIIYSYVCVCVCVFCFHQKANADRLLNDKPTTILLR